jgi:DNA-directed RNA polymerase specialized sigma24 family protein
MILLTTIKEAHFVITDDTTAYEICQTLLKRIAWRLQYRIRAQHARELLISVESREQAAFSGSLVSKLYVEDLIMQVPSDKGRYILRRLILDAMTEKEIAAELQISQQAVNKWKAKSIQIIREYLTHSSQH